MGRDTGDLLQGTLGLLILKALGARGAAWLRHRALDPGHHRRRAADRGGLALSRRCGGWRTAASSSRAWGLSENNRRARYYAITPRRPAASPRRRIELDALRPRRDAGARGGAGRGRGARGSAGARAAPLAPHSALLGAGRRGGRRRRAALPSGDAGARLPRRRSRSRRRPRGGPRPVRRSRQGGALAARSRHPQAPPAQEDRSHERACCRTSATGCAGCARRPASPWPWCWCSRSASAPRRRSSA